MYPIIIEFGFITVFSLWFFIAIGFTVGSLIFAHLAKRTRVRFSLLTDNSFSLFLWTLLISRAFFVVTHPDIYFYNIHLGTVWSVLSVWDKGLSFWGAILGWVSGILYLGCKRSESVLKLFDLLTPAVMIGLFFGCIGTFLDGINYGTPTDLPWGMTFRSANVKYISPIHPTQLYGAFYSLLLGFGLFVLFKKLRSALPGFVTEVGVFSFGLLKFFEEFLRGDETIKIFSMRAPQIAAALAVIAASYAIYLRYTNKNGGDPDRRLKYFVANKILKKLRKPDSSENAAKMIPLQNQMPSASRS
ncbi:prolipoprotein diacylglyceryl transferase [Candidatus Peregrinibacteria bacterium]|nr:prolipoprotein diacylglyceryl transferase [Candidatus Peregrinibacteria bacterium]